MSEQLTIELNDKEYTLSEEFRESIEARAANEFSENFRFDCWWEENARGDPVLHIETEGCWVPWDRLEELDFEMAPAEQPEQSDGDDSDETEDIDNGNGVKSVPKDEVDMAPDGADPASADEEDSEEADTKFMVTHPSKHYVPQPEEDDPEKLPPDPAELPEDPTLVAWIPNDGRREVWSTGKALVPTVSFIEWNVQVRADEAVEGETKLVEGSDGHVEEVPRTHNHDHWEALAEMYDCEVVATKQPSDEPTQEQQRGYSGREADEELDGKFGGNNFHV